MSKKTKTHNHAPHQLPIIFQRHACLFSAHPQRTPSARYRLRNNRARFHFFLHRAQLFTCASIAVYSFCTTHAPSTQSSHIKRAIITIASLPTGAIIAHRPNLRSQSCTQWLRGSVYPLLLMGEMSAFSNPKKRAHRRNARRFVAAALVLHCG